MRITVKDLQEYLDSYPPDATLKIATGKMNGLTMVSDFSHISESTTEVYGKEIVIHPYLDS